MTAKQTGAFCALPWLTLAVAYIGEQLGGIFLEEEALQKYTFDYDYVKAA